MWSIIESQETKRFALVFSIPTGDMILVAEGITTLGTAQAMCTALNMHPNCSAAII